MRATITMPLETLKAIIERAREYEFVEDDEDVDDEFDDEDEEEIEDDEDEDAVLVADDAEDEEIEEEEDDEDEEELADVLDGLTSDELSELLALSWVGEGDYENWEEALGAAKALAQDEVILQLAENPTLSEAIERGLATLGYEISED